jgi:hypothetical protein
MTPPKVFISYSQDSPEHNRRVLDFANALRAKGIDATIDQFEPYPEEGWARWMDAQIRDSDFVLLLCTENYLNKVQEKVSVTTGVGALWEANLIYNELYITKARTQKFIAVLFAEGRADHIPAPIRTHTYHNIETQFDALVSRLLGTTPNLRAPLGTSTTTPLQAEVETKAAPGVVMPNIDRFALYKALQSQLNAELLRRVIGNIPDAGANVPDLASLSRMIDDLLDWSVTVEGPGLEGVYRAVKQHFPNFTLNP